MLRLRIGSFPHMFGSQSAGGLTARTRFLRAFSVSAGFPARRGQLMNRSVASRNEGLERVFLAISWVIFGEVVHEARRWSYGSSRLGTPTADIDAVRV